jgi:hypothetical protein
MTAPFEPKLSVLPPEQRALWPRLTEVPDWFTLCGGTAIALHLGHRESLDFDFFADRPLDPDRLLGSVSLLDGAMTIRKEENTLSCLIGDADRPVQVSFFGVPRLRLTAPPLIAESNGIGIATLRDLAGMKAAVVQKRAEPKDYFDVDALMQAGIALEEALDVARLLYGDQFNPRITLKALTYFGEPRLAALPAALKARLRKAVRAVRLP